MPHGGGGRAPRPRLCSSLHFPARAPGGGRSLPSTPPLRGDGEVGCSSGSVGLERHMEKGKLIVCVSIIITKPQQRKNQNAQGQEVKRGALGSPSASAGG